MYDRYGFDSTGFNKDGYDIYGFNLDRFNKDGYAVYGFDKDGLNKNGYKKKSGKGLTISSLPILLSELNINNSKELINNIEQLIKYLYNNKQITKQVHNNLIKAITYKK